MKDLSTKRRDLSESLESQRRGPRRRTRSGSPTSHDNKSFISTLTVDHFPIKKVDVRIKPVQIPKRIWDLQFKRLFASPTKEEGSRVTRFSTWTPAVEAGILPSVDEQITSSSSDQEASDLSLSESETRTLALGLRPVKSKPNYRDTSDHRSSDSGASKSDSKSQKHSLKRLTRSLDKSSNRGPDRCRRKSNILSPRPNVFFDNEANKNVVIKDSFIKVRRMSSEEISAAGENRLPTGLRSKLVEDLKLAGIESENSSEPLDQNQQVEELEESESVGEEKQPEIAVKNKADEIEEITISDTTSAENTPNTGSETAKTEFSAQLSSIKLPPGITVLKAGASSSNVQKPSLPVLPASTITITSVSTCEGTKDTAKKSLQGNNISVLMPAMSSTTISTVDGRPVPALVTKAMMKQGITTVSTQSSPIRSNTDSNCMASPNHVMSDHAYGIPSPKQHEDEKSGGTHHDPGPALAATSTSSGKVMVTRTPQVYPNIGNSVYTPGAISADDESSENEGEVTQAGSSSKPSGGSSQVGSVWNSLNFILSDNSPVSSQNSQSQDGGPKRKLEKKKVLRKTMHTKAKHLEAETGTDTDDPEFSPRISNRNVETSRLSRKSSESRSQPSRKPQPAAKTANNETDQLSDNTAVEASDNAVQKTETAKETPPKAVAVGRRSRLSRRKTPSKTKPSPSTTPSNQPKISQFFEKSPRSPMENKDNTTLKQAEAGKDSMKAPVTVDIAGTRSKLEVSTCGTSEAMEIETGNSEVEERSTRPVRKSTRIQDVLSASDTETSVLNLTGGMSDTDTSKLDTSQESIESPARPLGPPEYEQGDLVWVRLGNYPWWPAMVSGDPLEQSYCRKSAHSDKWEYHVSFLGEANRAWIIQRKAIPYQGKDKLMEKKHGDISAGAKSKYINVAYVPKPQHIDRWQTGILAADQLAKLSKKVRLQSIMEFSTAIPASNMSFGSEALKHAKSPRTVSQSTPSDKDQRRCKKRVAQIEAVISKVPQKILSAAGTKLTAYKLYKMCLKVSKDPKYEDDVYCKKSWEELPGYEKHVYSQHKKKLLEELSCAESDDGGNRRSQASKRQQELQQQKEEKERKEAEKGPGWYYELVPVKNSPRPVEVAEEPVDLLGYKKYERCCSKCEGVTTTEQGEVLKCRGACSLSYHPSCLQINIKSGQEDSFKCLDCQENRILCSLCGQQEPPVNSVPALTNEDDSHAVVAATNSDTVLRRCNNSGCGRWFHPSCLTATPLWPQARVGSSHLICPAHMCHTCASDDPKNPIMKHKEKLVRCIRCPTAYHHNDYCMTAGTLIITKHDILCPKHYSPAKGKKNHHVNASWCFMCSEGGSLICCEICPAAFHLECLKLETPPEKYYCDNCETGRLPLYNEIVWVKIGAYRWWPTKVVPPEKLPNKIEAIPHQEGEFPVQFLGSGEYSWMNHGRAFLYEEGDSEKVPAHSSKSMDAVFRKGLKEAEELYQAYTKEKEARDAKNAGKRSFVGNKPAPYVKLKTNKVYGNCPIYTVDPEDLHPCDCDPAKAGPCGEDSNCINRMLMFECHPQVCNSGDKCENMRFQKRQYPDFKVTRVEGRGWGLFANQLIKKGSFCIEYVGELITMDEYRYRMKQNQDTKEENYYYLTIDNNRMIDAGPKGNNARFMNHSCDPNCITQKWSVNGDTRVGLFAIKDIEPGAELTFNYQLESVGDVKKPCLCGAANCSGFIGLKPKNEKDDKKKDQEARKKEQKKQKKLKKQQQRQAKEKEEQEKKKENVKIWESLCFRCHEGGSLIRCEMGLCPKVYHLSCIGKETLPRGKWHCPWHYCHECGKLVDGPNSWCIHCPSAYCRNHKDCLSKHPELSWMCNQHVEQELDFMLDVVREGAGLAELLPCPNPTKEQLSIWKKARGIDDNSESQQTQSKGTNKDNKKKNKNRFSIDFDSEEDTETSISREQTVSRSVTPSTLSTISNTESRPMSPSESNPRANRGNRRSITASAIPAELKVTIQKPKSSKKPQPEAVLAAAKERLQEMSENDVLENDDASTAASEPEEMEIDLPTPAVVIKESSVTDSSAKKDRTNRLSRRSDRQPREKEPKTPTLPSKSPSNKSRQSLPLDSNKTDAGSSTTTRPSRRSLATVVEPKAAEVENRELARRSRSAVKQTPSRLEAEANAPNNVSPPSTKSADKSKLSPAAKVSTARTPKSAAKEKADKSAALFSPPSARSQRLAAAKKENVPSPQKATVSEVAKAASPKSVPATANTITSPTPGAATPVQTTNPLTSPIRLTAAAPTSIKITPVKQPDWFKREDQVVWKCVETRCRYLGTDDLQKMQNHLSYHGLPDEEVHRLAANILAINMNLKMATRTLYKLLVKPETILGASPQKLVSDSSAAVYGYEEFECLTDSECRMTFSTELELINHLRRAHSSIVPASPEPQKPVIKDLPSIEPFLPPSIQDATPKVGYQCKFQGCNSVIDCMPGSAALKTHWMSHHGAVFKDLVFYDLKNEKDLDIESVYPYFGECALCPEICTSMLSMTDVLQQIRLHWKSCHSNSQNTSHSSVSHQTSFGQHHSPTRRVPMAGLLSPPAASSRKGMMSVQQSPAAVTSSGGGRKIKTKKTADKIKVEPMTITDEIDYKSEQDEINTDHEDTKPLNKSQSRLSKSPAGRKPSLAGIKPTLGKVVDDEMVADPMELRGPFTCQMFKCKQTLDNAQSVLRHCREQHPDTSLAKKTVHHNNTERVVYITALYRYVLQCGFKKCNYFVYRNSSEDEAQILMKNHWTIQHSSVSPRDFIFQDLSVNHPVEVKPVSVEEPLQLSASESGPYYCSVQDCSYMCSKWTMFTRHKNSKHPELDIESAGFIDSSTQSYVTVFNFASFIMACRLCRCAFSANKRNHTEESLEKHFRSRHDDVTREDVYNHVDVLKDENGQVAAAPPEFSSYRLAVNQGLIDNGRQVEVPMGALKCLYSGCDQNQSFSYKQILRHWNTAHENVSLTKFIVLDVEKNQRLGVNDVFKCTGECPTCGVYSFSNTSYAKLYHTIKIHNEVIHNKEITDFRVILPPSINNAGFGFELVESLDTEDYFLPLYPGPYYCMGEDCQYKWGKTDMKSAGSVLLEHWQAIHGDPVKMLYYAQEANKVLTAKVICVNLVQCGYPDCGKYYHSVYHKSLSTKISLHLYKTHKFTEKVKDKYIKAVNIAQMKEKMSVLKMKVDKIKEMIAATSPARKEMNAVSSPARKQKQAKTPPTDSPLRSPTTAASLSPAAAAGSIDRRSLSMAATDTEDENGEEDYIGYDGPYVCNICQYEQQLSVKSNRAMMDHWINNHGHPQDLVFIDRPTNTPLRIQNIFLSLYQCAQPGCMAFFGSNNLNTLDSKIRFKIKKHNKGKHPEVEYTEDKDMFTKVYINDVEVDTEMEDTETDTLPEGSEFVFSGPWKCTVKGCDVEFASGSRGKWRMMALNHFILEHDDLFIGDMSVFDVGLGKVLKIQNIFRFVGQCNIDGCYMIKGVMGRNMNDGRYELNRAFASHFRIEHNGAESDYTILVDNQKVLFVRDGDEASQVVSTNLTQIFLPQDQKPDIKSLATEDNKENRKRKSMSSVPDSRSNAQTSSSRKRKRMSLAVTEEVRDPLAINEMADADMEVYECEVCQAAVTPKNFLTHCSTKHSAMNQLGIRVLRVADQKFLNLLELCATTGTSLCKCGQCEFVYKDDQGKGPVLASHNRRFHNGKSIEGAKIKGIGYLCTCTSCWKVFQTGEEMIRHMQEEHSHLSILQTPFRNMDTHTDTYIHNIFKYVQECHAKCGKIFYHNTDSKYVESSAANHCIEDLPQTLGLPSPSKPVSSNLYGYQCMAGFGGGSDYGSADNSAGPTTCNLLIPSGNLVNALKHWQYKHKNSKLKEFLFMVTHSQKLITLSGLYPSCARCPIPPCNKTYYLKNQNSASAVDIKMSEHFARKHPKVIYSDGDFQLMKTSKLLSQDLPVQDEEIVEAVKVPEVIDVVTPTRNPQENEVSAYACAIPKCNKIVLVTSSQAASVAINRLKTHYKNKHDKLPIEDFAYKTILKKNDSSPESVVSESVQENQESILSTRYNPDPNVVYRCPTRSCCQVSVFYDSLRLHWENTHREYVNAAFHPFLVPSTDVLIDCPQEGCIERKANMETLNQHLISVHARGSDTATTTPTRPGVSKRPPKQDVWQTRENAAAAKATTAAAKKDVKPQPQARPIQLFRCEFGGCQFASDKKSELVRHRRENGHGEVDTELLEDNVSMNEDHANLNTPSTSKKRKLTDERQTENVKKSLSSGFAAASTTGGGGVRSSGSTAAGRQITCDIGGNFDFEAADLSGEDSDEEMDINYY